jgi:hypothetical protein
VVLSACEFLASLLSTLNDTNAAVQTLRDYVHEINGTPNDGSKRLSRSLVGCLRGLFDDLSAVQKLVPSDISSFSAKVKGVLDKKAAIDGLMRLLEGRNMALAINLGIAGLYVPVPTRSTIYAVKRCPHSRQAIRKAQYDVQKEITNLKSSLDLVQNTIDHHTTSCQAIHAVIHSIGNSVDDAQRLKKQCST